MYKNARLLNFLIIFWGQALGLTYILRQFKVFLSVQARVGQGDMSSLISILRGLLNSLVT